MWSLTVWAVVKKVARVVVFATAPHSEFDTAHTYCPELHTDSRQTRASDGRPLRFTTVSTRPLDDLVRVLCGGRRAVAISLDCEMPTI